MTDSAPSPKNIRELIEGFVRGRLQAKLDKLKPEEGEKRVQLEAAYQVDVWLADAARRVGQIQFASHILKPLHPDAKGTNLRVRPTLPSVGGLVGSFSAGDDALEDDVVGNAAALDVYKFLNLHFNGQRLIDYALKQDAAFLVALSRDPEQAAQWCSAFAEITEGDSRPASHYLAKQLYFPVADDEYHLLAPLFPTSLVHAVQKRMREDRFGERAKAAREARGKGESSPHGFREYPGLAIQKFGGTKPQNISQLNSERYGENWLLSSLPPIWDSGSVNPVYGSSSVFGHHFGRSKIVREKLKETRGFLEAVQGENNTRIRRHRARLITEICDEAHQFAARLLALNPGWTSDARCELHEAEQHWLDPDRTNLDAEFAAAHHSEWPREVGRRFAGWLNGQLTSKKIKMDDDTHTQWTKDLFLTLSDFRQELEADRD